jgi:hypothetical protein
MAAGHLVMLGRNVLLGIGLEPGFAPAAAKVVLFAVMLGRAPRLLRVNRHAANRVFR